MHWLYIAKAYNKLQVPANTLSVKLKYSVEKIQNAFPAKLKPRNALNVQNCLVALFVRWENKF